MEYTKTSGKDVKLVAFVSDRVSKWKDHRDQNYLTKWQEYERIWRGIWNTEDRTRQSERAKIISPATQQAIENIQAEIEEAVFGNRKEWFDIEDDVRDQQAGDILMMKKALQEAFRKDKIKKYVSQCITLGQVYGTGVGELQMREKTAAVPATEPLPVDGMAAVGVSTSKRVAVDLRPIVPYNFFIDPNALDVEDAFGCGVEEYVSIHTVIAAMEAGTYRKCDLGGGFDSDSDLERTQEEQDYHEGRCRVIRYYGLVPAALLTEDEEYEDDLEKEMDEDEEEDDYFDETYDDLVEAIVVIANDGHLLKKEKNPLMMEDRPFVVYRPEIVPGRFWGRGTAEKAYNMQKALDGQVRAHLDSVALTAAPMMGIDATRMPRGYKFEIASGRSIFTNGSPGEILFPLTFGQTSPVNIETAQLFERFLQQATGTIDSAGLPQQVGQQSDPGAMAMAMSGLIKKNKRSLLNFQEDFLIPLVEKAAWRYMQFDPDQFPVKDFLFIPVTNMGIMAREYEQQQFIGLMQTLGPDSPITPLLMAGIVENSSLSSKGDLVEALKQMTQPNPEQQQAQAAQQQMAMRQSEAQTREIEAKASKTEAEAQAVPLLTKAKLVSALSTNLDDDMESKDFERRVKLMDLNLKHQDLALKEKDIESNERISAMQTSTKQREIEEKNKVARLKIERDAEGNLSSVSRSVE